MQAELAALSDNSQLVVVKGASHHILGAQAQILEPQILLFVQQHAMAKRSGSKASQGESSEM